MRNPIIRNVVDKFPLGNINFIAFIENTFSNYLEFAQGFRAGAGVFLGSLFLLGNLGQISTCTLTGNLVYFFLYRKHDVYTIGENIIATIKMRNNFFYP